jgi:hypothetical protein
MPAMLKLRKEDAVSVLRASGEAMLQSDIIYLAAMLGLWRTETLAQDRLLDEIFLTREQAGEIFSRSLTWLRFWRDHHPNATGRQEFADSVAQIEAIERELLERTRRLSNGQDKNP